jgi:hypothetical protein
LCSTRPGRLLESSPDDEADEEDRNEGDHTRQPKEDRALPAPPPFPFASLPAFGDHGVETAGRAGHQGA